LRRELSQARQGGPAHLFKVSTFPAMTGKFAGGDKKRQVRLIILSFMMKNIQWAKILSLL
jgi:hypothetical protein